MEGVGTRPLDLHEQNAANAHHIGPFDDNQSDGNVPGLMFPRAGKEQHQEQPMEPLFQTGTFGCNGHSNETSLLAQGSDESCRRNGGDVDAENMLQYPAGFTVDAVHRP